VCYRVRMNVRTNLLLPKELVAEVDRVAGPRGRSRYVADALERQLRRDRWFAAAQATAGAWADHPLFPTDESVVEWVRAGRAEGTDPWDDAS
jgi:predicted transcriptional regulator